MALLVVPRLVSHPHHDVLKGYPRRTTLVGFFWFKPSYIDELPSLSLSLLPAPSALSRLSRLKLTLKPPTGVPCKPKCCLASAVSPIRMKNLRTATPSLRTKAMLAPSRWRRVTTLDYSSSRGGGPRRPISHFIGCVSDFLGSGQCFNCAGCKNR